MFHYLFEAKLILLMFYIVATRTDSCVLCARLGGGCVVLTSTRCSRGPTCQSTCYLPITGMPGMF